MHFSFLVSSNYDSHDTVKTLHSRALCLLPRTFWTFRKTAESIRGSRVNKISGKQNEIFASKLNASVWFWLNVTLHLKITLKLIKFSTYSEQNYVYFVYKNFFSHTHTHTHTHTRARRSMYINIDLNSHSIRKSSLRRNWLDLCPIGKSNDIHITEHRNWPSSWSPILETTDTAVLV